MDGIETITPDNCDTPEEFQQYHVGRTARHRYYTTDDYYYHCRIMEDTRAYRDKVQDFPSVDRIVNNQIITRNLYRVFSQHKWLPLVTAFPFNLRLVHFVIMLDGNGNEADTAWKLVHHIRGWGCPVPSISNEYDTWCHKHNNDLLFNKFTTIQGNPYFGNRQQLVKDLIAISKHIEREDQDDG